MVYVLDTHAVVWFLEGSARLSAVAKAAMSDPDADLVVPTIVLVETVSVREEPDFHRHQYCSSVPDRRLELRYLPTRRAGSFADSTVPEHSRRDHRGNCFGLSQLAEAAGRSGHERRRDNVLGFGRDLLVDDARQHLPPCWFVDKITQENNSLLSPDVTPTAICRIPESKPEAYAYTKLKFVSVVRL
jgi:hypothetical protein